MKINWTVRIKNKVFWVAIIPAVLLLVQQMCGLFGFELDVSGMADQLIDIVSTVFVVLALLGIVNDPTTDGISDSEQAMHYDTPRKDGE